MGDKVVQIVTASLISTAAANGISESQVYVIVDALVGRLRQRGWQDDDRLVAMFRPTD